MGKNRLVHFGAGPYARTHHIWNRHRGRQRIRGLLIFLRLSQETEFSATENGKKKPTIEIAGPAVGILSILFDREAAA